MIVERHVEVRGGVNVDVADAFGMAEHGDARIGLHVAHELVRTARNHQIDQVVELAAVRPTSARCWILVTSASGIGSALAKARADGFATTRAQCVPPHGRA